MERADTSILQVFGDIADAFGRLIKIYPDTCEGRRDQAKFKADLAYTNAVNNANRVLKICKKNAQDPNDEAARFNRDADLNLARAKYEACIIMALDQYLKNGGKPSNERQ